MICSFNFLIVLAVCLNMSTVINFKILAKSNQQTQSYKFTRHIAAFLSVVLITEMLDIIWSKRSTDFKELSPCSVWYPLKEEPRLVGSVSPTGLSGDCWLALYHRLDYPVTVVSMSYIFCCTIKANSACWSSTKWTSLSSHWKVTCSRHDIAEVLQSWC